MNEIFTSFDLVRVPWYRRRKSALLIWLLMRKWIELRAIRHRELPVCPPQRKSRVYLLDTVLNREQTEFNLRIYKINERVWGRGVAELFYRVCLVYNQRGFTSEFVCFTNSKGIRGWEEKGIAFDVSLLYIAFWSRKPNVYRKPRLNTAKLEGRDIPSYLKSSSQHNDHHTNKSIININNNNNILLRPQYAK